LPDAWISEAHSNTAMTIEHAEIFDDATAANIAVSAEVFIRNLDLGHTW